MAATILNEKGKSGKRPSIFVDIDTVVSCVPFSCGRDCWRSNVRQQPTVRLFALSARGRTCPEKHYILYVELCSLRLWGNKFVSHTLSAPPPPPPTPLSPSRTRPLSVRALTVLFQHHLQNTTQAGTEKNKLVNKLWETYDTAWDPDSNIFGLSFPQINKHTNKCNIFGL